MSVSQPTVSGVQVHLRFSNSGKYTSAQHTVALPASFAGHEYPLPWPDAMDVHEQPPVVTAAQLAVGTDEPVMQANPEPRANRMTTRRRFKTTTPPR